MATQKATKKGERLAGQAVPQAARDGFTTGLGVLAATLGSAVGLGNIWKFPFLTGANGGAAFIIIYVIATLLVGLPVMISEHALGRRARADAISTFQKLAPGKAWWVIGAAGVLAAFLILAFYTEVAGWVFSYIFSSFSGAGLSTDPAVTSQVFTNLVADPVKSLLIQWFVLVVVGAIILLGVSKGIEGVTKRLMPLLFLLLVAVCIRSLTLPGASQGLVFLFKPDFSKVTGAVLLTAMGLAFFKLSIGMGTMITYGSYFREDQNIPATALRVMLADLSVSLLAGIAIFPAVFAFGFEPGAGPSLLFITIPAVFASMPFGNVFMVCFFLLAAIAATGAMISLFEVPVAFLSERTRLSRPAAVVLTVLGLGLVGSLAALSGSTLSAVKPFGMTFFDLFDYVSSNILLPVGGLFICLFVGWSWGKDQAKRALSNEGQLRNERVVAAFSAVVRFVSPVLVLIVLLKGLNVF